MRVLVFGAGGMLGHKLIQILQKDLDVWGTVRGDFDQIELFGFLHKSKCLTGLDVSDEEIVKNAVRAAKPDVVINAVGIIKQLQTSKDVIKTLTINSIFPHCLAALSEEFGFRLISISTDCVFDGAKGNYYEDDISNATDLYGKSKSLGEVVSERALTLRTSIIGRELATEHSLVEWFLSNRSRTVKGYGNAIYSGFPTIVLADIIRGLIVDFPDLNGLYHVSSEPINKYDLLKIINRQYDTRIEIERFEDFYIDRSLDSRKFRNATGFQPDSWETMIEKMASDPTPYEKWRRLKT